MVEDCGLLSAAINAGAVCFLFCFSSSSILARRPTLSCCLNLCSSHKFWRSRSIVSILTPGYAPIEQYNAKGDQGAWTDVYGMGAVLYSCISVLRKSTHRKRRKLALLKISSFR